MRFVICNAVQIFDVNGHNVNCSNKMLEIVYIFVLVELFNSILLILWHTVNNPFRVYWANFSGAQGSMHSL